MTALCTNPRSPRLGFPASGRASKNAADHHGARASFGLVDIKWNRAEPDTFSSLSAPAPRRVKHRDAEPAVQDRPAIHSACTPPVLHMEPTWFGGFPGQGKTVALSGVGVEVGRLATRKTANMPVSKAGEDTVGRACGFVRVLVFGGILKHPAGVASRTPGSYSRDLAHFPFATAIANLRPSWALPENLAGASAPVFFGKVLGQGVGALLALIFNSNLSRTSLAASPNATNSEFAG